MMSVRLEHAEKALIPIVVTEPGMVRLPFFPSGQFIRIDTSLSYKTPSIEQYEEFSGSTMMSVRLRQPKKGCSPISVTELGMVTDVNPVQCEKAWSPILVTVYVVPS